MLVEYPGRREFAGNGALLARKKNLRAMGVTHVTSQNNGNPRSTPRPGTIKSRRRKSAGGTGTCVSRNIRSMLRSGTDPPASTKTWRPCGDETSVAAVCSPRTVASKSVVTVGVHTLVAATSVAHRGVGQDSEAKPPSQRAQHLGVGETKLLGGRTRREPSPRIRSRARARASATRQRAGGRSSSQCAEHRFVSALLTHTACRKLPALLPFAWNPVWGVGWGVCTGRRGAFAQRLP